MREQNHKLIENFFFFLKGIFNFKSFKKKVRCIILSDSGQTGVIEFKDPKRKLLNRGGIDSFILLENV